MGSITSFSMDAGLETNADGNFYWYASADFNGREIVNDGGTVDTYQEAFTAIGEALDSKAQQLLEAAQSE